jgi:hypothetical protein
MWIIIVVAPGMILLGSALALLARMARLVNRRLPAEDRLESGYWYFGKLNRVRNLYRIFYPAGHLADWEAGLETAAAIWVVAAAASWLHAHGSATSRVSVLSSLIKPSIPTQL